MKSEETPKGTAILSSGLRFSLSVKGKSQCKGKIPRDLEVSTKCP